MNGLKLLSQTSSMVLIASTILLASASSAKAGPHDGINFREFREQNPDVDRYAARAMFRDLRDTAGGGGRNRIEPASFNAATQSALQKVLAAPTTPVLSNESSVRQLRGQTRQSDLQGNIVRLKTGLDLDLTSSTKNISLGKNLFGNQLSITINTGDGVKTVSAGSMVSAAEYIAVKQVLSGDGQKLTLDKSGRAIGGSVDLDAITNNNDSMRAAQFVNAKDVTTVGDFSKRSEFKLLGDLNNFGTVIADSGSSNARSGAIRAADINNYRGATISSNLDLTLDAAGNLNNVGTITSTGSLTLTAGNSISNSGSVSAVSDLNLNANAMRNQGNLASANGNINLNASPVVSSGASGAQSVALEINNRGGSMSAVNGAINLRDAAYTDTGNSFLTGGGDLFSKDLNINAGQGTAWVDARQLTGKVNQTGSAAHIIASTEVLNIGEVCLTGDPTYFNTSGSILINGSINVAENLVIAASGNIASIGTVNLTARNNSQGFDITLIAGADFKNTGGANKPVLPDTTTPGPGAIRLSGKSSSTGGAISLTPNTQINTRPLVTTGDKNGGHVQMFAFAGKGIDGIPSGLVDFDMASVQTGGSGTGKNGDVLIVAGTVSASTGRGVLVGTIDTRGGTGSGGNVDILTAAPTVSVKGATVTYGPDGAKTSAASLVAASKLNKKTSVAILGTITTPGTAEVHIDAGKDIAVNNVISGAGIVTLNAGSDLESLTIGKVSATDTVFLNAGGAIGAGLLPFLVDGPKLVFGAKDFATIKSDRNGALEVTGEVTKGSIKITANGATMSGTTIAAKDVSLQANLFGTFQKLTGSNSVALVSNGGTNFTSSMLGQLSAPKLGILTGGSIGTILSPFELSAGTTFVEAVSTGGGNIVMTGVTAKEIEFHSVSANNVIVSNSGSLLLSGNNSANGSFSASTATGVLTIDNAVNSNGTQTYNSAGNKGKLVVNKNTALLAGGAITITVGATTNTQMPASSNVSVQGNVVLTGNAIKGKKPESTISGAAGKQIKINNGGSISFGGDVLISTN